MRGMKIIAEIFSIKTADQPEAGRFRQIQRIPDRDDGGSDLHVFGFANGQRGRGRVDFENGNPAAHIRHELARCQLFPIELNRKVASLTPHRICGINRAGRIDEKAGAGKLAVLVGAVNLHHRFFAVIKNVFNLATDGRSRLILRSRG